MADAISIQPSFELFTGIDGEPLEAGFIYIGTENLEPIANPVNLYWDEALTVPAAQPLRTMNGYISRGGSPGVVYSNATTYSILVTDKKGQRVYSALSAHGGIAGLQNLGFKSPFSGAKDRTQAEKNTDIISVLDFSGVDPTGVIDSTSGLQKAIDAAQGKDLDFSMPGGLAAYLVSASLTLYSNSNYKGLAYLNADSVSLEDGILSLTDVSDATIENLFLNCNGVNGIRYGVYSRNGIRNRVYNCYIKDTAQAGIRMDSPLECEVRGNSLLDCGRTYAVGGGTNTNNHGIMLIGITSTPLNCVVVDKNRVINTNYDPSTAVGTVGSRKGIALYLADGTGVELGENYNTWVANNYCKNINLAGIMISDVSTYTTKKNINVHDNTCEDCYTNIEVDNVNGGTIHHNISRNAHSVGYTLDKAMNCTIDGNIDILSVFTGMKLTGAYAKNNIIKNNIIIDPNTSANPNGAGIASTCTTTDHNDVSGNNIIDTRTPALMEYGLLFNGTGTNNKFLDNHIPQALTKKILLNSDTTNVIRSVEGRNTGFGADTPLNTVDITGGLSIRGKALTIANGSQDNLALPALFGSLYTVGNTADATVTGIAGGFDGCIIDITNYVPYTLTLKHNSSSSSVPNRILIGGSADLAIPLYGNVWLKWLAAIGAWVVTAKSF